MRHIVESQQFNRERLLYLFELANEVRTTLIIRNGDRRLSELLIGKVMCTLFYEPSTRTRVSFEMAAHRLGMRVITTEAAEQFSSAAKGETLSDTIRIIGGYGADVIVLRHKQEGASKEAAATCERCGLKDTHIVNAGDGKGQHPTQALLDLFTIWLEMRERGISLDGLTVAIGGDLKHGRTVRSLAYLLKLWKAKMIFVSPPELAIGEDIKQHLTDHGIEFREETDLISALPVANVIYWTRAQRERMGAELRGMNLDDFVIGPKELDIIRRDAIIMHPLPRVDEIAAAVDEDPRAAYFRQAVNGLYIRMALLLDLYRLNPFAP
jgi:aspartate carbamoyltransferase catalytic subunit